LYELVPFANGWLREVSIIISTITKWVFISDYYKVLKSWKCVNDVTLFNNSAKYLLLQAHNFVLSIFIK
jgi:hypothetical protein